MKVWTSGQLWGLGSLYERKPGRTGDLVTRDVTYLEKEGSKN